ncbi:MBL fold metallo-hydrolase, partial [Vibrio cholerae]|nr:MBL fold metallo-hydrolase [Vibrio cholerae]
MLKLTATKQTSQQRSLKMNTLTKLLAATMTLSA